MFEISSPHQIINLADRRDRPGVGSACMVLLCVALLGLLVVPMASAGGGSSRDDGQIAESLLFP